MALRSPSTIPTSTTRRDYSFLCVRNDSSRFVSADPVLGDGLLEEQRSARFRNSLGAAGGGWPLPPRPQPALSGERSASSRNRPHGKSPRICVPDDSQHDLHEPPDFARRGQLLQSQGESYHRYFKAVPSLSISLCPRPGSGAQPNWQDGVLGEMFFWIFAPGMAAFTVTLQANHFLIALGPASRFIFCRTTCVWAG
jgi:hypothetical protein